MDKKKRILNYTIVILAIVLVSFLVYKNIVPNLSEIEIIIISPHNVTYDKSNVLVMVSSNKPVLWISNSFDDSPNITECRNCNSYARYDLIFTKGTHTIKAYASDFENRVIKADVTFTIK